MNKLIFSRITTAIKSSKEAAKFLNMKQLKGEQQISERMFNKIRNKATFSKDDVKRNAEVLKDSTKNGSTNW